MDLGVRILDERVFELTTLFQSIADEAKVSQTTILRYFKDRSNLLKRIINYVLESNQDFVSQLSPVSNKNKSSTLHNYFRGNFRWAKTRPDQAYSRYSPESDRKCAGRLPGEQQTQKRRNFARSFLRRTTQFSFHSNS